MSKIEIENEQALARTIQAEFWDTINTEGAAMAKGFTWLQDALKALEDPDLGSYEQQRVAARIRDKWTELDKVRSAEPTVSRERMRVRTDRTPTDARALLEKARAAFVSGTEQDRDKVSQEITEALAYADGLD